MTIGHEITCHLNCEIAKYNLIDGKLSVSDFFNLTFSYGCVGKFRQQMIIQRLQIDLLFITASFDGWGRITVNHGHEERC